MTLMVQEGSLKSGVVQILTVIKIIHWSNNRGHNMILSRNQTGLKNEKKYQKMISWLSFLMTASSLK